MAAMPFSRATGKSLDHSIALQSFKANDWAKHFIDCIKVNPTIAQDEGTMTAWFACALMRGWDERGSLKG